LFKQITLTGNFLTRFYYGVIIVSATQGLRDNLSGKLVHTSQLACLFGHYIANPKVT